MSADGAATGLRAAEEMARENPVRIRNESAEYRAARERLLVEEIALRRQHEQVAALRRALPAGGPVEGDYRFITEDGPSGFAGLFGEQDTLIIYSMMFGPERERPCPMCTNQMGPWDANAADIARKASLVVVARSPIERLTAWKRERGWRNLRMVSDANGNYSRDYFGILPDGSEIPALHIFTRRDGTIRHFWAGEMTDVTADPGQDPRGDTPAPLWQLLDLTPEGRAPDWYPSLDYA
jgi:predicted dithiol-disulfide oxidoreductase (DUF899 family)